MSFSSDVKSELVSVCGRGRRCRLAELFALLEFGPGLVPGTLAMDTDNALVAEKYEVLMKKVFAADVRQLSGGECGRVCAALEQYRADRRLLVQQTCCRRSFIRGAFMASGSISDPSKSYHFEVVCKNEGQAQLLQELINGFGAEAKIVERKKHFVVYLKEGSQIVDMLSVMGAHVSLMNLENVRILKEMRNTVNRKVNCETANINKTVSAAVRQIEDIRKIQAVIGFDGLSDSLRGIAELRLEYPDATLKELGEYLDPPVGKSGVNHRLRKLSRIAEDL